MKITIKLIKLLKKVIQVDKEKYTTVKIKDSKVNYIDANDLLIKFIYLNVFGLIKESKSRSVKHMDILKELSDTYSEYYDLSIKKSWEKWIKTILPPYIHGYKNFIQE